MQHEHKKVLREHMAPTRLHLQGGGGVGGIERSTHSPAWGGGGYHWSCLGKGVPPGLGIVGSVAMHYGKGPCEKTDRYKSITFAQPSGAGANNANERNFLQAASTDGSTLTYELMDLIEGQEYFVRVRAENMAGVSMGFTELDEPVCAKEPVSKYILST